MDGSTQDTAIDRPTARVLALEPQGRVLLMLGSGQFDGGVWFAPGGGLEAGEGHEAAAVRELWEETSLRVGSVGPCVWLRTHAWCSATGVWFRSCERFFVAHVPRFEPRFADADDPEARAVTEHRWWSVSEIARAAATFAPRRLAELLPPILDGRYPPEPVDVGV